MPYPATAAKRCFFWTIAIRGGQNRLAMSGSGTNFAKYYAVGLRRRHPLEGWTMKLDRIDIKILHELQNNGRVTNVELAELVNLSPSPCLIRVKKLQAEGYIEGYSAQINM